MAHLFGIGDRVEPSAEGLQTFPRWANREGRIVGRTPDLNVWQVKWDDCNVIKLVHADFIVPTSLVSQRVPISSAARARLDR